MNIEKEKYVNEDDEIDVRKLFKYDIQIYKIIYPQFINNINMMEKFLKEYDLGSIDDVELTDKDINKIIQHNDGCYLHGLKENTCGNCHKYLLCHKMSDYNFRYKTNICSECFDKCCNEINEFDQYIFEKFNIDINSKNGNILRIRSFLFAERETIMGRKFTSNGIIIYVNEMPGFTYVNKCRLLRSIEEYSNYKHRFNQKRNNFGMLTSCLIRYSGKRINSNFRKCCELLPHVFDKNFVFY